MKKLLLGLVLVVSAACPVMAAAPPASTGPFLAQMDQDATTLTAWFSDQLSSRAGFLTGVHMAEPPQSLQFVDFEIAGVAGFDGAKLDVDALKNLPLTAFVPASLTAQAPAYLPIPYGRARIHIGLPSLFILKNPDIGLTAGGLSATYQGLDVHLADYGIELRSDLFEDDGPLPFTVCVALGYDYMGGSIAYQTNYRQHSDDGTYNYDLNLSKLAYQSNLQNAASTVRVTISRQILLLVPYVGAAYQRNIGSTQTQTSMQGSVTVTDDTDSTNNATTAFSRTYSTSAFLPPYTVRALAGLDFDLGPLQLNLGGEYDWLTGDIAGHFGLAFGF